jgi:hypothetical protein
MTLPQLEKLNQTGFDHFLVALAFVVIIALGVTYFIIKGQAASPWSGALKVNMAGTNLCMENMNNSTVAYTSLLLNTCSSTVAPSRRNTSQSSPPAAATSRSWQQLRAPASMTPRVGYRRN